MGNGGAMERYLYAILMLKKKYSVSECPCLPFSDLHCYDIRPFLSWCSRYYGLS